MTLGEFIIDLKQQPWELEYVQCILVDNELFKDKCIPPSSYINVFQWSKSSNIPVAYWNDLHYVPKYRITDSRKITIPDIIRRIKHEYKDSHPEFLI